MSDIPATEQAFGVQEGSSACDTAPSDSQRDSRYRYSTTGETAESSWAHHTDPTQYDQDHISLDEPESHKQCYTASQREPSTVGTNGFGGGNRIYLETFGMDDPEVSGSCPSFDAIDHSHSTYAESQMDILGYSSHSSHLHEIIAWHHMAADLHGDPWSPVGIADLETPNYKIPRRASRKSGKVIQRDTSSSSSYTGPSAGIHDHNGQSIWWTREDIDRSTDTSFDAYAMSVMCDSMATLRPMSAQGQCTGVEKGAGNFSSGKMLA
ncbi:hypothetical protein EK21DRAFT_85862 [Setomelanomma holmii]|uniref:Uncharacterized protein n=1 Tax=Setomelanomma holmii TaxID=210430 RepID=A0A9P4LRT6_9PLEO|nr:hypothetical protein EK21DRAFT_85862 [Setomelanomma holmii]